MASTRHALSYLILSYLTRGGVSLFRYDKLARRRARCSAGVPVGLQLSYSPRHVLISMTEIGAAGGTVSLPWFLPFICCIPLLIAAPLWHRAPAHVSHPDHEVLQEAEPTGNVSHSNHEILQEAELTGNDVYFSAAEASMSVQWDRCIWPHIKSADFGTVLELAFGHCRNTMRLAPLAGHLIGVDINPNNVAFCKRRFGSSASHVEFHSNGPSGLNLRMVGDASVSLVYSWDAMVHFPEPVIAAYATEFARVMRPDGLGFIHHSNLPPCLMPHHHVRREKNTTVCAARDSISRNAHARAAMTKERFAEILAARGLTVLQQTVLDWHPYRSLDCITLFKKERHAPVRGNCSAARALLLAQLRPGEGTCRFMRAREPYKSRSS